MLWRVCLALPLLLLFPIAASAQGALPASDGDPSPAFLLAAAHLSDVPAWSVAPFAVLLLCIAVLPLAAEHFWHKNRNRALVAGLCALPAVIFLARYGAPGWLALGEALCEYFAFIVLLGALFTVAGGIVLHLNIRPSPLVNGLLLASGAVLANLIGTTGASMLLIRPYLRINKSRRYQFHLPIFFIFLVSNLGGLLTPLGDPPLFLGFLRGVPFHWTLQLWPEWLLTNALVLAVFLVWDTAAFRKEPAAATPHVPEHTGPVLHVRGLINLVFLLGIIGAVVLKAWLTFPWELTSEALMLLMAAASLGTTPRLLRHANAFVWDPMIEVAVLFLGIFITMIPALVLLSDHGSNLGLTEPWQFFWLTGLLSSGLDNAPTYLAFVTVSAGHLPEGEQVGHWLVQYHPDLLRAISCGAVFMGANTYIGNGPNFMVKAIADHAGYRTPSFFGYLGYSTMILLPIFVLVTLIFFRPF
jgi:Na+/H+ antiporter NhaD/arsenite permease-like protein